MPPFLSFFYYKIPHWLSLILFDLDVAFKLTTFLIGRFSPSMNFPFFIQISSMIFLAISVIQPILN
ncbi:unnamed protein product [Meloidogyne enterolobii]|uniref:Uncharacterized protein n=1 Tax=Meloidogyne enterolobii TaxID=390850 RepID=A0ACB1AQN5_MELEN